MSRVILTLAALLCTCSANIYAELQDLTESELSDVTGEGVGYVYEDFQFNTQDPDPLDDTDGHSYKITGIVDDNGDAVDVAFSQIYISGAGSQKGTNLDGNYVNIGRLNNPFEIELLNGNDLGGGTANPDGWTDKAVLSFAAPTHIDASQGYHCTDATAGSGSGTCSSRPQDQPNGYKGERMDIGVKVNSQYTDVNSPDMNINFYAESAHFDGSYFRVWGGDADVDGNGSDESTMMMESRINLYADKLVLNSCDLNGANCGSDVTFDQFKMELAIGDAKYYQPATFDVTNDGYFKFKIQALPTPGDSRIPAGTIGASGERVDSTAATWDWYDDYYTNGAKSNISVDNLTVGSESFGASRIQGLQIQYLEVTSRDI
ncbi:hypothetical protein [Bermanella sp. R86510]|uniref:hypothetical protein n=1 Tax=unclassified Bermanella TaxID=2627862 RepID=UPI0037C4F295